MHISIPNPFKKPTPKQIAQRDLEDAERQLLLSQSQAEYHNKMSEYYFGIVNRLTKYVNENERNH